VIDREGGDIVFHCDQCPEHLETEQANWDSAWNFAKRQGWHAKKVGTEWIHVCSNCYVR
jgi:hypothetical protein